MIMIAYAKRIVENRALEAW